MSGPSPDICPLCQQPNACVVAAGGTIGDCWCSSGVLDARALAAVAPRDRGARCLCPRCGNPTDQERVIER